MKAFFYKGGICIRNKALPLGHWARDYGNGFYVIYVCFNKADKDCKTRDTWLAAFDFYIKKLCPQLEKRKFITVNINGKVSVYESVILVFDF